MLNPLWEASEEPEHFAYAKFVVEQRHLPRSDADLATFSVDGHTEVGQPPLYYLIQAPFVAWVNLSENPAWLRNPYFAWNRPPVSNGVAIHTVAEAWPYRGMVLGAHIMRAVSVGFGIVTIAAIYATALAVTADRRLALITAAAAGLTPAFLLSSASINNDAAAILSSTLSQLAAMKAIAARKRTLAWLALYGLCLAVALMSKANTLFLLPLGLVLLVSYGAPRFTTVRARLLLALAGVASAVVIVAWWLAGYGAHYIPFIRFAVPGLRAITVSALRTYETYWGSYGWDTVRLPLSLYIGFGAILALAAGGWLLRLRRWRPAAGNVKPFQFALLGLAAAGLLAGITYRDAVFGGYQGAAHARFLLPVLPAASLLLTCGLSGLPGPLRRFSFQVLFGLLLFVAGYSLYLVPRLFGPQLNTQNLPYAPVTDADIEHASAVRFEHGIVLLGWSSDTAAAPGGRLRLRLFWQTSSRLDREYSAFLRFVQLRGRLAFGADHSPGSTNFVLPTAWPPAEMVPDEWQIAVPPEAPAGLYELQVGLYDPTTLEPLHVVDGWGVSATLGTQSIGQLSYGTLRAAGDLTP